MNYCITGVAGFIGFFVASELLRQGNVVIGIDSINNYYSVDLKESRLKKLKDYKSFYFFKGDIQDNVFLNDVFKSNHIDTVINFAAQSGVRNSIFNPTDYGSTNLFGFLNVLEQCRKFGIKRFIFASSSSVYGMNKKVPYSESDITDNPISLYAATKKANEVMAYSYSHLYGIDCTGLRFFTVYGPMGRPDMAYFKFAKKIMADEEIEIYNNGDMLRDFTYIDDIVKAVILLIKLPLSTENFSHFEIYNIGNEHPENLMKFISLLEKYLGKKAKKKFLSMQLGDVYTTCADTNKLYQKIRWKPNTSLEDGLKKFTDWFLNN